MEWFNNAKLDIKEFEAILIEEGLIDLKAIRKLSDNHIMYVERKICSVVCTTWIICVFPGPGRRIRRYLRRLLKAWKLQFENKISVAAAAHELTVKVYMSGRHFFYIYRFMMVLCDNKIYSKFVLEMHTLFVWFKVLRLKRLQCRWWCNVWRRHCTLVLRKKSF